jgi:hypothetical protein
MKRYRARYISGKNEGYKDWDGSNPITALTNIHRFLQLEQGLKSTDYTILSFAQIYSNRADGKASTLVESKYDLPPIANPNMHEDDDTPVTETVDAFPEAIGGKLAD